MARCPVWHSIVEHRDRWLETCPNKHSVFDTDARKGNSVVLGPDFDPKPLHFPISRFQTLLKSCFSCFPGPKELSPFFLWNKNNYFENFGKVVDKCLQSGPIISYTWCLSENGPLRVHFTKVVLKYQHYAYNCVKKKSISPSYKSSIISTPHS